MAGSATRGAGPAFAREKESLATQLRFYEDQLSELNRKIEKVNEDYYEDRINDAERQEWVAKSKDQREAASEGKQKMEVGLARLGRYDLACEHLRDFSRKLRGDVSGFSYAQKQALIDLLVERVELSDGEEGRHANVLFRFDPKEIASSARGVEPALALPKPKTPAAVASGVGTGLPHEWWTPR